MVKPLDYQPRDRRFEPRRTFTFRDTWGPLYQKCVYSTVNKNPAIHRDNQCMLITRGALYRVAW